MERRLLSEIDGRLTLAHRAVDAAFTRAEQLGNPRLCHAIAECSIVLEHALGMARSGDPNPLGEDQPPLFAEEAQAAK